VKAAQRMNMSWAILNEVYSPLLEVSIDVDIFLIRLRSTGNLV
jgi:hypothetical protein